jgi:hypothetical protein
MDNKRKANYAPAATQKTKRFKYVYIQVEANMDLLKL